jgi:hypothetical protein
LRPETRMRGVQGGYGVDAVGPCGAQEFLACTGL